MTLNLISCAEWATAILLYCTVLYSILLHYAPPNCLLVVYLHIHSILATPIYSSDMLLVHLPPLPTRLLRGGSRRNKAGQGEKGEGEVASQVFFNNFPPHCFLPPLHIMQKPVWTRRLQGADFGNLCRVMSRCLADMLLTGM